MVNPSKGGHQASPARGRSRGETHKPSARARSPRTACNFCHDKRVKCVMVEGDSRCEQCLQRNTDCVFSTKAKTGPKPKNNNKSKADGAPRHKGKNSRSSGRRVRGAPTHAASVLPKPSACGGHERSLSLSSSCSSSSSLAASRAAAAAAAATAAATAQPPVAANTAIAGRERLYLGVFSGTIGKFVPLVPEEVLSAALSERQRLPQAVASAVGGADRVACEQAQVLGAISLGALISGDLSAAHGYYLSLRYHLGDILALKEETAVPSLALVALYWQHRGEDDLKIEWVGHARRVLANTQDIPANLVLSIEYLDYAREAHARPGVDQMPAGRRALHSISCLLANMPAIVNPAIGRAAALDSCQELNLCIVGLRNETSVELTLLLCTSLRALLLAMLGQRDAAIDTLDTIPSLVDLASGGNPSVVRALPLSWDALLIASALAFFFGQGGTYQRLRSAVELATDVPVEARWTFCLPEVESDPRQFVSHDCRSSSNICNIMCEIATKTEFGGRPFYADGQEQEQQQQQHAVLTPPAPAVMPTAVLPSPPQHTHHNRQNGLQETAAAAAAAAIQHAGGHRYGYGYGGKAIRRTPSDLHGMCASGGAGGAGAMPLFDGDVMASAEAGTAAAAAAVSDGTGVEGGGANSVAYKRRRMTSSASGSCQFEPSGSFAQRGGRVGGPFMPSPAPAHPVYGAPPAAAAATAGLKAHVTEAKTVGPARSNSIGPGGNGDLDDGGSLTLLSGLHNMSLSRLSVPLSVGQISGPSAGELGRVPSEGIMDLSSSMGSFGIDMVGADGGGQGCDRLASFANDGVVGGGGGGGANSFTSMMFPPVGGSGGAGIGAAGDYSTVGKKRSFDCSEAASPSALKPLRLSSFGTYSTVLCRSASKNGGGGDGDEGSIGQCGSDLGHDIVTSAEDFMSEDGNEDDICGNILSVDAMLGHMQQQQGRNVNRGGAQESAAAAAAGEGPRMRTMAPEEGGGGGGGEAATPAGGKGAGGGGSLFSILGVGSGGGEISLSLDDHQKSMSALADFYESGGVPSSLSTHP